MFILRAAGEASGRGCFVAFAVLALVSAIRVVTHRRPVYSALYFVLVIAAFAGLLVVLQAEFLAAALVIIYAGAILVTYVFVIMLAQQSGGAPDYDRQSREPVLGVVTGFVVLAMLAGGFFAAGAPQGAMIDARGAGTVANIGTHLLTQYWVGVEVAGVLLLAAMVGAIAIARRRADEIATADAGEERL
ncbi:MAG: NADH-quinone oxidoreductase subunit J [Phycisphaerae bacterium]